MRFEFSTAARILFGPGSAPQAVSAAQGLGRKALLVTGQSRQRAGFLTEQLDHVWFPVAGEPTLQVIRDGVRVARDSACDLVIGMGGGGALDAAKAIAALVTNPGDPLEYVEVIGAGRTLGTDPLPFLAIPTTAGTGAEVTRNAVLGSPEHRLKVSLRSPRMLAKVAIVDPELSLDLPRALTASTGLDALTQLIEPYVGVRANPMTDLYCLEGLRRVGRSLVRACEHGGDLEARTDMAFAALLGGLSLANAGLGVVHGFAGPVGGRFDAPHGAVCAALLPHGMAVNIRGLARRGQSLQRFKTVAEVLTGSTRAHPEDGTRWVYELCRSLEIPPLSAYGVGHGDLPSLVQMASVTSSIKGNPVVLDSQELTETIERAL